jgi:hypothetical protein
MRLLLLTLLSYALTIDVNNANNQPAISAPAAQPSAETQPQSPQPQSNNTISSIEKANLLIANLDLLYINEQVKKCVSIENPAKFADCEPAIKDPIATCCRFYIEGQASLCFPIVNKYPALFKNAFIRDGFGIDCPILNNFSGSYNDTLINDKLHISPENAEIIYNNTQVIMDMAEASYNCTSIENPSSFASCSKAFDSPYAKCCYVSGSNGNVSINNCNAIPNASYKLLNEFYGQNSAKIDCGGSAFLENGH